MEDKEIILYHYSHSPWAARIVWYLALRGIPYNECMQPRVMPRPDLARLGVSYRRIPVLAIGRDVYLDTRLQLKTLEELYPSIPKLGASDADSQAVQHLLSRFIADSGIWSATANMVTPNLPVFDDPKFVKDRSDYSGVPLNKERMLQTYPDATTEIASAFRFLETTLLADGRDWILKTGKPSLADIEATWPFQWLIQMPVPLPEDKISDKVFPLTFAWLRRFRKAAAEAQAKLGKPRRLSGEAAAGLIFRSGLNGDRIEVDTADAVVQAQKLHKGDEVVVWPTDSGASHRDVGKLVGMNEEKVVIECRAKGDVGDGNEAPCVRVHAPRHGFRVRRQKGVANQKL